MLVCWAKDHGVTERKGKERKGKVGDSLLLECIFNGRGKFG